MIRFLIDADLPRFTCPALHRRGYPADDVRDLGLGAATDDDILEHARAHEYTLTSADALPPLGPFAMFFFTPTPV